MTVLTTEKMVPSLPLPDSYVTRAKVNTWVDDPMIGRHSWLLRCRAAGSRVASSKAAREVLLYKSPCPGVVPKRGSE